MDSTSDDYFEESPRVCRFGNWKKRKFSANRDFPEEFNETAKIFIDEYEEDIAGLVESEEDDVDYGYLMDHEVDYMNGVNSVYTEIISSDSDDELINSIDKVTNNHIKKRKVSAVRYYPSGCGINAESLSEEELEEEFTDKYEELERKFTVKYEELEKKFTEKYEELEKKISDKCEELEKKFNDKYEDLEKDSASDHEESPRVCCSPRAFDDEYDEDIAGLINESEEDDDVDYGYLMDVDYMNGITSVYTEIISSDSDDELIYTSDKETHNNIKKRKVSAVRCYPPGCGPDVADDLTDEELINESNKHLKIVSGVMA